MKENIDYLKDVLGIRYVGHGRCHGTARTEGVPSSSTKSPVDLGELKKQLENCRECKLHKTRTNLVFGTGNLKARLMFVGEGPGEQEDLQGIPFVGMAGQLLTKMIVAMGIKREDVYIANVVKCRPPGNRNPEPDEIEKCSPHLLTQIDTINPEVIVALGTFAAQTLLKTEEKISALRGKVKTFHGKKFIATFHPAYLLRNPSQKKFVWEDLQLAMTELGMPIPPRQS